MPSGIPIGLISYPGVENPIECTATIGHGRAPGTISLSMAPQQRVPSLNGDLSLIFGDQRIILRDCLLDRASLMFTASGQVVECTLLDHRWRWIDAEAISGWFNARVLKGSYAIKQGTEKTPRQLAELCLKQLKEPRYDLSQMENGSYPSIDWDAELPAAALDDIANRLGCHIVYEPISNQVKICKVGEGKALPGQNVMEPGLSWDFPNIPKALAVVTGHCLIQGDFDLEAVGLEPTGAIVPINSLSYRPTEGWVRSAYDTWEHVPGADAEQKKRNQELARRSVFRWYRVKFPFPMAFLKNALGLDETPNMTDRLYLALEAEQVDEMARSDEQVKTQVGKALGQQLVLERKPAEVYGSWCRGTIEMNNVQESVSRQAGDFKHFQSDSYFRTFSIDLDKQIVMFDQLTYKNQYGDVTNPTQLACIPAVLKLRTACRIRRPQTGEWLRYKLTVQTGAKDGPTRMLKHDEIIPRFDGNRQMANTEDVKKEAQWYVDQELRKYRTQQAGTIKYLGLVPIELDGAIQQVTWHVGNGPTWTQASRNTEPLDTVPSYRERWLLAKSADAAKASNAGVKPPEK